MTEDYPEYLIKQRKSDYGETMYLVKWIGCDVDDNTWETEEKMLAEWPMSLTKYKQDNQEKRNGKTEQLPKIPKITPEETFAYTNSLVDWESQVDNIEYVEKSKVPGLIVYINWKNGLKSVHHSSEVYAKCPQKMIEYFESHVKFNEIFADD